MSDFWVRAAGGQDYVVSHQNEQHRKNLMVSLKQATKAVITDSVDSDRPLTASAESVNALCYRLEAALCHGLQGGDGKYRGQMVSFWDFIKHCIKSTNSGTLKRSLKEVEKLQRVHTADGQGRAWIRFALNNSIVFKAFDVLTQHKDIFKGWYAAFALMASHENTSMLLSLISSLNDIEFNLALDDPNLDCAVVHDEPGQAKYPAAAPTGHAPTKKKRKKRVRTTVAVIEDVKAKKGTATLTTSTDDAEVIDLASIAAISPVEAAPQAQDADLHAVIEAFAESVPTPDEPSLKQTEAEVAAANAMRIEEERLERERQQLAEEQRKFEEEKRKLLQLQQQAETEAEAAKEAAEAEKAAAEVAAAEEAAKAKAAEEKRAAEAAQRAAEALRAAQLAEEQAAQAEKDAALAEEKRIAELLEEQREKERARKAAEEETRVRAEATARAEAIAREEALAQEATASEAQKEPQTETGSTLAGEEKDTLTESASAVSVAALIDGAQDQLAPEPLDEEARQHLLDRIIETTPATVYSPSHTRGLSVGTSNMSSGSAEELNDQDIEAIMNSIEATAYVDEIDIEQLIAETVVTVPGDRRDYFSLAVAADPTPLLQASPAAQEVHIVDALPEASGPPQPELESGGGPFVRQGRMVRTEEGETALDLTETYADLSPVPRGPPGWKPLRRLVYFHIHTKTTTEDQDNVCAGCASPFSFGIFSTIRYCEYFGKFFCARCHDNDTYFIPGRILQRWDLTHYKVSRKALEFLETIYDDPLFDVTSINPALYEHNPDIRRIKVVRQQLFYMKDFLVTCNQHALGLIDAVEDHRRHLVFDKQVYSLRDFVETAQGSLLPALHSIAESFIVHIKNCQLCRAKGFICEFCNEEKPIYPFQLKTVVQCVGCKSFFHRRCYKKEKCPKCLRKLMLKHERQYKAELEYEE